MKLTKSKLKQIIKEEIQKVHEAGQSWEQLKQKTIEELLANDQKGPDQKWENPIAIITSAIMYSSGVQTEDDIAEFAAAVAEEFTSHPLNQEPHGAESTLDPQETIDEVFAELDKLSREDYESRREDEATNPW